MDNNKNSNTIFMDYIAILFMLNYAKKKYANTMIPNIIR